MNKQQKYKYVQNITTLVTVLYAFIAVAYLFLAPGFQYRNGTEVSAVKSNTQLIYTLIRTNRCMANDNKQARGAVRAAAHSPIPLLNEKHKISSMQADSMVALNFVIDRHFIYLSNRVLRI